jgi:hypothetical protein
VKCTLEDAYILEEESKVDIVIGMRRLPSVFCYQKVPDPLVKQIQQIHLTTSAPQQLLAEDSRQDTKDKPDSGSISREQEF